VSRGADVLAGDQASVGQRILRKASFRLERLLRPRTRRNRHLGSAPSTMAHRGCGDPCVVATEPTTRESVESRTARASGSLARRTPSSNSATVITETAISSGSSPSSRPVSWAMNIEVSAIARLDRRAQRRGHRRDRPVAIARRRRVPGRQCGGAHQRGPQGSRTSTWARSSRKPSCCRYPPKNASVACGRGPAPQAGRSTCRRLAP
jgi:hypothetical protein